MSIPSIPGYLEHPAHSTLADLWQIAAGDFPVELWPVDYLRLVSDRPSGWLTIREHFFSDDKHGGVGCVLVRPEDSGTALRGKSWIGRELGEVSVWDDGGYSNGLQVADD